jgi:Outer membrane protein beta-barrel domain
MKKSGFVIFAILVISTSGIQAQGLHVGIKGGANIAQMTGRSFEDGFKWSYMLGGFVEVNFNSKWGLQPELLFSQTNTQTSSDFESIYPNEEAINNQPVKLNYMTIPVLLSWKPIPILSIQAGPQFGILLNSSENILGNGENAFKSGDFALVGGAQVNLGHFILGARYVSGMTNLDNVGDADTWKNNSFQAYIGFRLF